MQKRDLPYLALGILMTAVASCRAITDANSRPPAEPEWVPAAPVAIEPDSLPAAKPNVAPDTPVPLPATLVADDWRLAGSDRAGDQVNGVQKRAAIANDFHASSVRVLASGGKAGRRRSKCTRQIAQKANHPPPLVAPSKNLPDNFGRCVRKTPKQAAYWTTPSRSAMPAFPPKLLRNADQIETGACANRDRSA